MTPPTVAAPWTGSTPSVTRARIGPRADARRDGGLDGNAPGAALGEDQVRAGAKLGTLRGKQVPETPGGASVPATRPGSASRRLSPRLPVDGRGTPAARSTRSAPPRSRGLRTRSCPSRSARSAWRVDGCGPAAWSRDGGARSSQSSTGRWTNASVPRPTSSRTSGVMPITNVPASTSASAPRAS